VSYFEITQEESIALPSDRTVTILVRDDIAPAMIISSPDAGFGTRGSTIRVEGTTHDSQSGFDFNASDRAVGPIRRNLDGRRRDVAASADRLGLELRHPILR